MFCSRKLPMAGVLAVGLLFGAAADAMPSEGTQSAVMEESVSIPDLEGLERTGGVREFEPTEGAPLGTLAVDPELRQIGLSREISYTTVYHGGTKLFYQTSTELFLSDGDGRSMMSSKNFPQLAGALEEYNFRERKTSSKARNQMRKQALGELQEREKTHTESSFHAYYDHSNVLVKRADACALSFLHNVGSFTNGVHGMYAVQGENFDTQTGKRLELIDVFMNVESLPDIIINRLRETYDSRTFFESMESTVTKSILEGSVDWTLGARGVTFYFNPYAIGPYASGILKADILFDERPGIFREKYKRGAASYCEELPIWQDTGVSLRDDGMGKRDILRIGTETGHISICLNGKKFRDEQPVKEISPVFVHLNDGRNYVYVDCVSDAFGMEHRELRVYSLNDAVPSGCGILRFSFQRNGHIKDGDTEKIRYWIMTDPNEFCMDEFAPSDQGNSKTHVVEVGSGGTPAFG